MFFCKKCENFSQQNKCMFCGAKKLRQAEDNDPAFLTEVDGYVYCGMLEGALKHNKIPFIKREKHGGVLKYVGFAFGKEEYSFFVPFGALDKAKQILAEIFEKRELSLSKSTKKFRQTFRAKKTKK